MTRVAAWIVGIVGIVGVFLGLFILFAGDDQYVGIGGDWSWRAGDIADAWAYGFLAGGIVLVVIAALLAVQVRQRRGRR